MSTRRLSVSRLAIAAVFAIVVASCSTNSTVEPPSTTVSTSPARIERPSDGILRIGLLVPLGDERAPFGPQLVPVVEAVVRLINNFEGFNSQDIEFVIRDEGLTPEAARKAARELINADKVDAVIGPFSSSNAPSVVPVLVDNGIAVCSPSVSSLLLDVIESDGLFIRTATVDSTIVENMVELAVSSGSELVSIAYPDDPYGRNMAHVLRDTLRKRTLGVVSEIAYQTTTTDYTELANEIADDGTPVKLIIADQIAGPLFLNAVVGASQQSVIITNDAVINTEITFAADLEEELRPKIFGLIAETNVGNNELLNLLRLQGSGLPAEITQLPAFSVNTVDCLFLMWMAALTTTSDDARIFKNEFLRIANDGAPCLWIGDCKFAIDEKLNVDYVGIAKLDLDQDGNAIVDNISTTGATTGRRLLIYEFGPDGRARLTEGLPSITLTSSLPAN